MNNILETLGEIWTMVAKKVLKNTLCGAYEPSTQSPYEKNLSPSFWYMIRVILRDLRDFQKKQI